MRSHPVRACRWIEMSDGEWVTERRAHTAVSYSWDELRGRSQLYLRRRRDKERLALHLMVIVAMAGLTAWWVVPHHSFSGRVVYILSPGRGIHVGDLPAAAFVLIGLASAWFAVRALDRLSS
jgi:hypothetical protein